MATLGREESFLMGTCTRPAEGTAPGHGADTLPGWKA